MPVKIILALAVAAVMLAVPVTSDAGGLFLTEFGTEDVALAGAGWSARAQDASTLFKNPAGMSRLQGNQFQGGLQALYFQGKFNPSVASHGGGDGGNPVGALPAASGFYVHSLSKDLKVGLGVFSNFGLALKYDGDWAGRYYVRDSALIGVTVAPVASYRVNEWISIGGGPNIMQRIAAMLANPGIITRRVEEAQPANQDQRPILSTKAIAALQNKRVPVFMLSNQLPMLQLGREFPEVAGQRANYCEPEGPDYRRRMVKETAIIAFSDPNDILSYGIPVGFTNKYLDSRLCASVTNISINVAKVIEALETGTIANPLEAHVGYMSDDRVIALIAKGIDNPNTAPLVTKRCGFTKIGH